MNFLNQAAYYIRTLHEKSTEFNSNLLFSISGVLQDSRKSPVICLVVSLLPIITYDHKFLSPGFPNLTGNNMNKKSI